MTTLNLQVGASADDARQDNSDDQEIVNRPGWASGNALVLIYTSTLNDGARDLVISMYDVLSSRAAKLDIVYTAPTWKGPRAMHAARQRMCC